MICVYINPNFIIQKYVSIYIHTAINTQIMMCFCLSFFFRPTTESPRRYVETDVNIHYKTPIRFEYKDPVPEAELAYRQAEHMKKLYHEERRRKYLQELQDMSNRRHADYFTPSQKSPIALNRYDDFGADMSPISPNSAGGRTIARALYNFQGQTAR